MAESHFKPLLALSGKPAFAASRSVVIQQLSEEQLSRVNEDALLSCVGKESQEALAHTLLDFVIKQQETAVVGANTQNPISIQSDAPSRSSALPQANVPSLAPENTKRKRKAGADKDGAKKSQKDSNRSIATSDHPEDNVEGVLSFKIPGLPEIRVDQFLYEVAVWAWLPPGGQGWRMLAEMKAAWARKLHARIMSDYGHDYDWDEVESSLDEADNSGLYPFGACIRAVVMKAAAYDPRYFGGSKEKACDGCVNSRNLCLKMVGMDLRVLRLPDEYRRSKDKYDMASFVIED